MNSGEIRIKNETVAELPNFLLSRGLPLPPGAVTRPEDVRVRAKSGQILPSCGRVLQDRPDGSIEWLLLDVLLDLRGEEKTSIFLEPARATENPLADLAHPVKVDRTTADELTLSNGLSSLTLCRGSGNGESLIRYLELPGKILLNDTCQADLEVVDSGGKIYRASLFGESRLSVVQANPLTATIRLEGKHQARDGQTFMDFALLFTLSANCPDIKMDHTFYCREAREGRIPVTAMRLVWQTAMDPGAHKVIRQAHHGHDYFPREMVIAENMEVVSSSVGDLDHYRSLYQPYTTGHPSAGGTVFLRNDESLHEDFSVYPFHMRPGGESGFRAEHGIGGFRRVFPFIGWREKNFTLSTLFERWRQLHPKSIAIDENRIVYSFWPEWSVPLELVQGVSKTHTIWLTGDAAALSADEVEHRMLRWEVGALDPVDISLDPAWPAFCQVLDCQHFLCYQPEKYPLLENLIEPYPAAGNPNRDTYDRHSPSGMLNFGDFGAPGWSNNEDDVRVLFPLLDYLRTGRTYCFDVAKEAARHYMEVDFCEWSTDPRQRGGFIAHTNEHFVGCVYPSHQWAEGILAYYYLTGDERARKAVIACGDNYCYWVEHHLDCICCDGREAGMPLVNLAAAYRLTRDEKYLQAAGIIVKQFHKKWFDRYGDLRYPYPQGAHLKIISGYGDWSSYAGLYRIWEVSGNEEIKELLIALLKKFLRPESFNLNDARAMDFMSVWIYIQLTGDREGALTRLKGVIPMLVRRGGHALRRLHFLKIMDEEGLIDDTQAGNRAGVI